MTAEDLVTRLRRPWWTSDAAAVEHVADALDLLGGLGDLVAALRRAAEKLREEK